MRLFNAITCWTLWVFGVLTTLMFLNHQLFNSTVLDASLSSERAIANIRFSWEAVGLCTLLSMALWFARRRFWYNRNRRPGLGFWAISLFLYGCIIFIPALSFFPFFSYGRSPLQSVGLKLGGIFLALTFPHLPKTPPAVPPLPASSSSGAPCL
jgi:hypothetical protein